MKSILATAPVLEPITRAELLTHLRLDSGTFDGNLTLTQSIFPGDHVAAAAYSLDGTAVEVLGYTAVIILSSGTNGTDGTVDIKIQECETFGGTYNDWAGLFNEVMTLNVAPGGTGWVAGDTITGATSKKTCVIVTVLTTTTYVVKDRSGTFTLGEVLSNGTNTADQGTSNPIFNTLTEANDNATYKKAYTGTKRYIKTVATVAGATCDFGTSILVNSAVTAEDDDLTDLITEGRQTVENITRRALLTQTWYYYLDEFPEEDFIKLPFGNLQSAGLVITYKDSDGTVTTMTLATDYLIETNGERIGRIVLPYGESWPSDTLYPSQAITIEFAAGWTTAALVPKNIKRAVRFAAEDAYYHGNRHDILNVAIMNLLSSYRLFDEF